MVRRCLRCNVDAAAIRAKSTGAWHSTTADCGTRRRTRHRPAVEHDPNSAPVTDTRVAAGKAVGPTRRRSRAPCWCGGADDHPRVDRTRGHARRDDDRERGVRIAAYYPFADAKNAVLPELSTLKNRPRSRTVSPAENDAGATSSSLGGGVAVARKRATAEP